MLFSNKWKRLFCMAAAGVLTISSLAGCGKSEGGGKEGQEDTAMGRYLEEEVKLPEGLGSIMDIQQQEDGGLGILASGEGEEALPSVWFTRDGGKTWEKGKGLEKGLPSTDTNYFISGALSARGKVVLLTQGKEQEGLEGLDGVTFSANSKGGGTEEGADITPTFELPPVTCWMGSAGEGMTQIDFSYPEDLQPYWVKYTQDGKLATKGITGDEGIYLMDPQTSDMKKIVDGGVINFFTPVGNSLVVSTHQDIQVYDLSTGKPLDKQEALSDEVVKNRENLVMTSVETAPVVWCGGEEEDVLYFCNREGLFSYTLGGSVVEQMINGGLTSISNPAVSFKGLTQTADGGFYLSCVGESGSKIYKYTYSKDTPSVPSKQLKVYSLEENQEIAQAISHFQKENPDVYIDLEIGLSGEDAVTVSDALRTLNTDLMAGNGPDILVLDGMPLSSYIEKGMLVDLSGLLKPIQEKDGLWENITQGYEREGKMYGVPARFSVPLLQTTPELLSKVKDLTTLVEQAKKVKEQSPEKNMVRSVPYMALSTVVQRLYPVCAPEWTKEDGTLDEPALKDFFEQMKALCAVDGLEVDEETRKAELNDPEMAARGMFMDMSGIAAGATGILTGKVQMNFGIASSVEDLANVISINGETSEENSWGLFNGQAQKVYLPKTVLGISSKSQNVDTAEEFLSYLMSSEAQSLSVGGGFPVNKAAFEAVFKSREAGSALSSVAQSWADEDGVGEMFEYDIKWPAREEQEKFYALVETLETPSLPDDMIGTAVMGQANRVVTGETTVDEAVKNVMQKINLYLAEQG